MVIKNIDFEKYNKMAEKSFYRKLGKVVNVVGLTIESAGPDSKLGDLCRILPDAEGARPIMAEVVGFRDKKTLLMPYDSVDGIGLGCVVENTGDALKVTVNDKLLGKTVNGLGVPIDGEMINGAAYPVEAAPPDPMSRTIIDQVLPLGVKAVDGMITVGKGQRIGIFAGSGVGKSTLMGMFARNTKADINVIALIGERGREVREFIERDLGEEGMRRSVVVVATSDRPALERNKAAKTATAIAEYFRDQGKDVLLMMDSLTRFSMAQREIGLASGEPPVTRGYPPSVYSEMPKLLERAGRAAVGSITGLYTVLVDGDDFNEPITDTARSILDGHIMLDRKLGHKNHYPAIDILQSISRCMSQADIPNHADISANRVAVDRMVDGAVADACIVHTTDNRLERIHVVGGIAVQFNIADVTGVGQCVVRRFLLNLLEGRDVVPHRDVEGVGVVIFVGHTRNHTEAFFIHADKASRQSLCRCCQQREVHLGLLTLAVAVSAHIADDFQTLLLHLIAFAVVMTIQSGQGFCQTDEANRKGSVLEHLTHLIVWIELIAVQPYALTHQEWVVVHTLGRLNLKAVQQLVGNQVEHLVQFFIEA